MKWKYNRSKYPNKKYTLIFLSYVQYYSILNIYIISKLPTHTIHKIYNKISM